jgi:hypothetical protein
MKKALLMSLLFLSACAASGPSDLEVANQNCATYGFTAGTEQFAGCVQQEVAKLQSQEQARWQAISNYWNQQQNRLQQQQMINAINKPTHCYGTGYGMTCY